MIRHVRIKVLSWVLKNPRGYELFSKFSNKKLPYRQEVGVIRRLVEKRVKPIVVKMQRNVRGTLNALEDKGRIYRVMQQTLRLLDEQLSEVHFYRTWEKGVKPKVGLDEFDRKCVTEARERIAQLRLADQNVQFESYEMVRGKLVIVLRFYNEPIRYERDFMRQWNHDNE